MKQLSDNKLAEISGEIYKNNVYLVGMHLRDAVNLVDSIRDLPASARPDLLAKASILFAVAGLETNLSYFCTLALAISDVAPESIYIEPELEYLKAVQTRYEKDASVKPGKHAQPLSERLQVVPKLLGKAFRRDFPVIADTLVGERLRNAIEKRDALIHPSWDRYPIVDTEDAADAVYCVLDYLETVRHKFHPLLIGYGTVISAYFPRVADLVEEQSLPLRSKVLEARKELIAALAGEWIDAHSMFDAANIHRTEGDSEGSMFTRAALVAAYSMVMVHVSILGRLAVFLNPGLFTEKEVNFFNEEDYRWTDEGEAVLDSTKQNAKDRVTVCLTLMANKTSPNPLVFDRGVHWFQQMFDVYLPMRNRVMHSKLGEAIARVSKAELRAAFEAIRLYAAHIATAGGYLAPYKDLLAGTPLKDLTPDVR
jgi:hypothetical protein